MTEAQALARATVKHLNWFELNFTNAIAGCTSSHILDILEQVIDAEVTGEKAHRFIGWAQAILTMEGYLNLDDARTINRKALEELK